MYASSHREIPEDFHFTDYEQFVTFAMDKEFDWRPSSKALFDQMKTSLEEEGLTDAMSAELEALEKAMDTDKASLLKLKKDEIIPCIEEDIVERFYFQEAAVRVRLRYDTQLSKAINS